MSVLEVSAHLGRQTPPQPQARRPLSLFEGPIGLGSTPIRVLPFVRLGGVRLHAVTENEAINYILDELEMGRGGHVVTPNLDHLRFVRDDPGLMRLYCNADLVVADGMPLLWAAKLQRTPLPERVAGSNLISSLSAAAAERGRSIFLLGGAPGTADGAAHVLKSRHPRLKIAGTFCPDLGFEHSPEEVARIMRMLRGAQPDLVYVALGSPKQERFIGQIRSALPAAWWLGLGASFSFLCGQSRRAPVWMQRNGLEWVHRLMHEPRRLAKRYLLQGLPFAASLLAGSAVSGMTRLIATGRGQHL